MKDLTGPQKRILKAVLAKGTYSPKKRESKAIEVLLSRKLVRRVKAGTKYVLHPAN